MPVIQVKMNPDFAGLAWKFQVNPDSCENPGHYESYLRFNAIQDHTCGMGTTHVMIEENANQNEDRIMGFVTLKASSLVKVFDDYREGHAALEITELAVDKDYERRGIGTALIGIAVLKAIELNEDHIGIEYLTLCSDKASIGFYTSNNIGFEKMVDYYELPREQWNQHCAPLMLKLHK